MRRCCKSELAAPMGAKLRQQRVLLEAALTVGFRSARDAIEAPPARALQPKIT
jgi:hypothetical protein